MPTDTIESDDCDNVVDPRVVGDSGLLIDSMVAELDPVDEGPLLNVKADPVPAVAPDDVDRATDKTTEGEAILVEAVALPSFDCQMFNITLSILTVASE